jgi:hypothetical protein
VTTEFSRKDLSYPVMLDHEEKRVDEAADKHWLSPVSEKNAGVSIASTAPVIAFNSFGPQHARLNGAQLE